MVVAIVGFLGACITLAPSTGFKTASIVVLVIFACVASICLLMRRDQKCSSGGNKLAVQSERE